MPAQPKPAIIPPPQPSVQPVPATPNPAPVIPVPVNPAPVNPPADGANYGPGPYPPGTTVIIVASPGGYRYPWGNTGGTWVPFYYNKQWHLYRSWCQ